MSLPSSGLRGRLSAFLEVHAEAEEQLLHPRLLEVGGGAADVDCAAEETEAAIGDHDEIREAIRRARQHRVGGDDWWSCVGDARLANGDRMAEEERQALADFRRHTDVATRHELGSTSLRSRRRTSRASAPTTKSPRATCDGTVDAEASPRPLTSPTTPTSWAPDAVRPARVAERCAMLGARASGQHRRTSSWGGKPMRSRRWDELSTRQQLLVMVLTSVQVSLAVSAWSDLARRPAHQVRGSKWRWAAVIGVNFVGPVLYFLRGRVAGDETGLGASPAVDRLPAES